MRKHNLTSNTEGNHEPTQLPLGTALAP